MNPKGIPPRSPATESARLPWEKRVVSANGVVARGRRWDTTPPLGLKIARALTQGSLADSATLICCARE